MIDRDHFYHIVRNGFFPKGIPTQSFEGLEKFLDFWQVADIIGYPPAGRDRRWLAYILATAYHETARTMQPIEEYGKGKAHSYGKPDPITGETYYGRGYVQLTWKYNYENMGKVFGIDLVNKPERALDADVAIKICFYGMSRGSFTGRKLSQYFNVTVQDWVNARKIINGMDKADLIASYAKIFFLALMPDSATKSITK
jgi:predicted chitinase